MSYIFSDTSTPFDGIVNNNYCDHIHVTVDDEDCCHASSHPNLYSSRRPEVAAAPLSLRSLNYASDTDLEETVQETRNSDRNVALLNSSLGRKGIRTKVPLLKTLDAEHILSWIDDMAAYAITKEDSDNSLFGSYIYTVPRTSTATSEPTIGSLDSLLELNLSPELKEQLESARSAITAEAEENVTGVTAATIPSPFEDTLTPPDDFPVFVSRDVMNSIHLISPHSLTNQFTLWNFLLDLTKVKTLEHAVRLLSSSSMNHSIRDPFSRLFDYIASFSKTCRRLSELDIPQKQLMLEFLKNLKPDSISSTLKKAVDFKQIHFYQLIQETHQLLTVHLEHSSRLKAAEPSSNRNTNQRRSFKRFSNPRNSPGPRSSMSNSRSNYSSPAPSPRFNTPRSEPRTPRTPDKSTITCFNCNKRVTMLVNATLLPPELSITQTTKARTPETPLTYRLITHVKSQLLRLPNQLMFQSLILVPSFLIQTLILLTLSEPPPKDFSKPLLRPSSRTRRFSRHPQGSWID
ncbi:hypothetical protein GEMRC1_000756 [Eukaryota sp. GEM-RC1]